MKCHFLKFLFCTLAVAMPALAMAQGPEVIGPSIQLSQPRSYSEFQINYPGPEISHICGIVIQLPQDSSEESLKNLDSALLVRHGLNHSAGAKMTSKINVAAKRLEYQVSFVSGVFAIFITVSSLRARTLEDAILMATGIAGDRSATVNPLPCSAI